MMSKKTFSRLSAAILLLLTVSIPVGAQEISVEAARQTAAKFINEHAAKLPAKSRKGMMKAPPRAESLQLVYTQEDQLHESPALYVFEQPTQGGFVIASADERVVPVFGYFEEGNFQDVVKESCCFKAVLENIGQQIAYARENGLPQFTSTLNDDNDFSPIEPITRDGVRWHQEGEGLNDYCPIDKETGERCVTGCVANTMAILMYHHQWPKSGKGSHSYQWRDTTLTANFGETTYRYELMGPSGSSETARLLYHCGVAVNMDYSSSGSGADMMSFSYNWMKFFRYNGVNSYYFDYGDEYTKVSEIHEALSNNNPLCASNTHPQLRHQFLIDGYQPGGFIHLNLHSGFSNGYVHISGLKDGWTDGGSPLDPSNLFYDGSKFEIVLFVPEEEDYDKITSWIIKDNIEYAVKFNKATIMNGTVTGDLEIPSTVTDDNGVTYPVTSIGRNSFSGSRSLTSVIIPNSVTSIGAGAFGGCDNLESVTIPNSVTSIGGDAFFNCSYGPLEIYMGSTVPTIDKSTFRHGPTKVYVPSGAIEQFRAADVWKDLDILYEMPVVIEGVKYSRTSANEAVVVGTRFSSNKRFSEMHILETITIDGKQYAVKEIAYRAFANNDTITSVVLPNTIETIAEGGFVQCVNLRSVTFGNSVTSIGDEAFMYCRNLTSVTIPNSVTSIGGGAFSACDRLTSVTIGNSVTSIGGGAFSYTPWYDNLPDGLLYLGKIAYKYKGTMPSNTSIVLQEGTLEITAGAFDGCSGLTSVTIPNSVTIIGSYAFRNCSGLTSVTIPNSVTSIGSYVFEGCSGLTSVTIPNSVTSIGERAFRLCSGLTSVTIPNSVTSIGNWAFEGCTGLTSVTFHCKEIGLWFENKATIKEIVLGEEVTSIGSCAFCNCSGLTSVTSCIENPFAIEKSVFLSDYWNWVFTDATLYVPIGTAEKYKSTDGWKNFKNIVEIEIDGIEGVTVGDSNSSNSSDSENAPMYTLSGQRVGKNYKGIVIKNGKKMIVK